MKGCSWILQPMRNTSSGKVSRQAMCCTSSLGHSGTGSYATLLPYFVPNKLAENKSRLTASQVALLGVFCGVTPRLWMDLPLW
jgi:hypothetical protein